MRVALYNRPIKTESVQVYPTTLAAAYQVEGGHHGQEQCSIFMVTLISCGVKKQLPSNSALQHSIS